MPVDIPTGSFDVVREEFVDERIERDPDIEQERTRPMPSRTRDRDPPPIFRGRDGLYYDNIRMEGQGYESPRALVDARNAMMTMMNDDTIVLEPEVVKAINDPEIRMMPNGEVVKRNGRQVIRSSGQFSRQNLLPRFSNRSSANLPVRKKKRKPSKYQKELGKQLKLLKQKHPRTAINKLMKRAHRATKKALK